VGLNRGFRKSGLTGGLFNLLVSKNSRNSDGNFYIQPEVRVFIAQKPGKWSSSASLFAFSATFCPLFL